MEPLDALMRKCPCPVWVVKPGQHERYARILAAVDTDPDDASKDALNRTIMELATSLAQLEQSELHVVHAWTLYCRTTPAWSWPHARGSDGGLAE